MSNILVVDDEELTCRNLKKFLEKKGHTAQEAHNGEEALKVLKSQEADLVLLDIRMPVMDGRETLKRIKNGCPDTEVIMITAVQDLSIAISCMKAGAFTYLPKPVNLDALDLEIDRALEHRRLVFENRDYQKNLEQKVEEKAGEVKDLYTLLEKNFFRSIRIFVELIELYDPEIGSHCKRVAVLSEKTGRQFNIQGNSLYDLEIAGLLHDVGKLGIPEKIRQAPFDQLDEDEVALMKQQTTFAQEAFKPVGRLDKVGGIIRSHLERFDGRGFPDGLKEKKIPLESRIIAVVNAYDEMKYRRHFSPQKLYKGKSDEEVALSHLKKFSEERFDPDVVKKFQQALKELELEQRHITQVSLNELREGMTLAEGVCDIHGKLLLGKGNRLSALQVIKLKGYHDAVTPINPKILVYTQNKKTEDAR